MANELISYLVKNITAPEIDEWANAAANELEPDVVSRIKATSLKVYEKWLEHIKTNVFYYLEFCHLEFCIKPASITPFYYGETWANIICNFDKDILQTVLDQKTEELNKTTADDFKRFKSDHLAYWFKNNAPARIKDETIVRWINELFASKFIQSEFDHHYKFTKNLWYLISKSGLDKKTILGAFNSRNEIIEKRETCKKYLIPLDSFLSPEHFFKAAVIYEFYYLLRKAIPAVNIKLFLKEEMIGCEIGGYSDLEIDRCINNYLGSEIKNAPNLLNNTKANIKAQHFNNINDLINNYDRRISFFLAAYNGYEYCGRISVKHIKEFKQIMINDYKINKFNLEAIDILSLKKIYFTYMKAAKVLKISSQDFETRLNQKVFWCKGNRAA